MWLESPSRLLFTGDSITDCGRDRSAAGSDLGSGYVAQVQALIGAHHPSKRIEIFNTGIGGHRVTDLESRWEADVLAYEPDYVSVMIGINDVWRQFDRPNIEQVDAAQFRAKLGALVRATGAKTKGVFVLSPFFLEPNREDPMRALMDAYGSEARGVAEAHGAHFVDVQAAFDAWLAHNPTQMLCGDRVHPNAVGHAIIARAFLDAVGFVW